MLYFLYRSTLNNYLRDFQGQKSWALITGASDGIGEGFAHELCAHGFNVVLHGRNVKKLSRVKEDLHAQYPDVEIRTVIADAASFTALSIDEIVTSLQDIHLTILINNVGGTGAMKKDFTTLEQHTPQEIDALISINQRFTVHLTRALLPTLKRQEPSLIMNICSTGGGGTPWLSVYSSTKAFLHAFSRALGVELKADGHRIEVLGVAAGSVQSQQNRAKTSFLVPSSREMARSALARVGCGRANVTGYFPHAIQQLVFGIMPEWVVDATLVKFLRPLAEGRADTW